MNDATRCGGRDCAPPLVRPIGSAAHCPVAWSRAHRLTALQWFALREVVSHVYREGGVVPVFEIEALLSLRPIELRPTQRSTVLHLTQLLGYATGDMDDDGE